MFFWESGWDISNLLRELKEVETPETLGDALGQLRGYRGPAFIAGTNKEAVNKAMETTKGTTVGVMDNQGHIVKPSTRKR